MKKTEFSFQSSGKMADIRAVKYVPEKKVCAVLQIAHGMDEFLRRADFAQQFHALYAVLLGPALKVDIVHQARQAPELSVLAKAQILRIPAHHRFHRQAVEDMKVFLVVLLQGGNALFAGESGVHGNLSFTAV